MNRIPHSPDLLTGALQLIALPACACNGEGVVMAANAALAALSGRDLCGMHLLELVSADWRAATGAMLRNALAGAGCEQRWDSSLQGPEGGIAVQVWARPLAVDGVPDGLTLAFADMRSAHSEQLALRKSLKWIHQSRHFPD